MEYLPAAICAVLFLISLHAVRKLKQSSFDNVMNLLANEKAVLAQVQEDYRQDAAKQAIDYLRVKADLELVRQRIGELYKIQLELSEQYHDLGKAISAAGMTFLKSKWDEETAQRLEAKNEQNS